jgi:hypothetical protein
VSEAALKALGERAKGAEPAQASARSQALADLSERAAGKEPPEPPKSRKGFTMPSGRMPTSRMPDVDPRRAEAALQMGTGTAGTIAGGLTGVASLIAGADPDVAADRVQWWQQALTYQPRSEVGRETAERIGEVLEHPANPMTWPGLYGETLADRGEELGLPPSALTILRMAPDAATAVLGAPGRVPAAARASIAEDVQAAGSAVPRAIERVADLREPDAPAPETNPFARESLGAAAAVPSQLKTASPALQEEVRKAARTGGVDREALERQLRADSLGLPPLTEGQATRDPVVLSTEINRRGKDTAFAHRFNQQNQAIIDKLDEFRQEAAPNVVGNDPIQNGQQLIDAYKAHDEAVRTEINAAYQAARDANGGDLPMDAQSFAKAADAALKKNMKARYLPSEIAADLAEIRETGSMNFEMFENMRTNLAAEARKAERSGDGNAAAAISLVRDALENVEPLQMQPFYRAGVPVSRDGFTFYASKPEYAAIFGPDVRTVSLVPKNTLDLSDIDAGESISATALAERLRSEGIDVKPSDLYSSMDEGEVHQHLVDNRNPKGLAKKIADAGYDSVRINEYVEGRGSDTTIAMLGEHSVAAGRSAAEVKPLFDTARRLAKSRFDRLKVDPAYKAAVDDATPMGEPTPLADDFVNKFVVKGKAANIDRMRETLAGNEAVPELIAAGAMNYLKSKSGIDMYTNEGNFSQAGYNRALSDLMPKLNRLVGPDVAEKLQALGEYARDTQFQPRGSFANNSNTLVAAAAEKAKGAAEGIANQAALGLPVGTWARERIESRAAAKEVERALRPGAGIEMKPRKDKP